MKSRYNNEVKCLEGIKIININFTNKELWLGTNKGSETADSVVKIKNVGISTCGYEILGDNIEKLYMTSKEYNLLVETFMKLFNLEVPQEYLNSNEKDTNTYLMTNKK